MVNIKPDHYQTHYFLGNTRTDLGEMVQAVFNYRNALLIEPQFYDCYHNLGLTLKELSRFEEAADSIDKATHLEPSFTKNYTLFTQYY